VCADDSVLTRSAIKYQMAVIQSQMDHRPVRRIGDVTKDADKIAESCRAISLLFDTFLVSRDCTKVIHLLTDVDGYHFSNGGDCP
jgi:hypothetical protein